MNHPGARIRESRADEEIGESVSIDVEDGSAGRVDCRAGALLAGPQLPSCADGGFVSVHDSDAPEDDAGRQRARWICAGTVRIHDCGDWRGVHARLVET